MVNTQEQTFTWNDAVSEPNRRLVFTARTGTDLRIILWIGLLIAYVSGPQRAWVQISGNGSGFHQTGLKCCNTQPNTQGHTNTYTIHTRHALHTHVHTVKHTNIHIRAYIPTYTYMHANTPKHTIIHAHTKHTHANILNLHMNLHSHT